MHLLENKTLSSVTYQETNPSETNTKGHWNKGAGEGRRAGEMIPEVEGTRPWEPPRKRVPKCLKGPKTTNTTMNLLKNSQRELKRAHFRYILGPPGPTQEMEFVGPGGEGPSRSPRFLRPWGGAAAL